MNLLPIPRSIAEREGVYPLVDQKLICLNGQDPQSLRFTAQRFQQVLKKECALDWPLAAGWALPHAETGLLLRIDPIEVPQVPGLSPVHHPPGVQVVGHDLRRCVLRRLHPEPAHPAGQGSASCPAWRSPTGRISPRAA